MADGILTLNAMMPEKDLTGEKMLEPGLGAGIGLAVASYLKSKNKENLSEKVNINKKKEESKLPEQKPPEDKGPDILSEIIMYKGIKDMYKGVKGLQHGAIERKLRKEYIETGMNKFKAYDKAMHDAFDIVNQKKLKIVQDKMSEINIQSDDYVDLIDEYIRLIEPDFYKDIKRWDNNRPDLADKQRALFFPDWAEARYGEDYEGVLQNRQAQALRESIDPNFKEPLSPADQMVSDIDDMNKANIDEIFKGRKKNATGGIAELLGEPRSGYGGRIGLADGDTPSEAYLRKIYYKIAEGDQLGTTTFDQWKRSSSAEYWRDKWRSGNRAEGGRIGYDGGGPINLQALIELYMSEGMTHDEAVAAANKPLPFHILTDDKAQGGRIGFRSAGSVPYLSRGWSQPGVYKAPRGYTGMEEILGGGILGIGASKFLEDEDKENLPVETEETKLPQQEPPEDKGSDIVPEIVAEEIIKKFKRDVYTFQDETKMIMDLTDTGKYEEKELIKLEGDQIAKIYDHEGFKVPKPIPNVDETINLKNITPKIEKAKGGRIGFKDGEGIMSRVGDMVDVRNIPYYSGKALQGLVNSAETLSKFPFAAGELGSKLIQQPPKKEMFMEAIEDITPGSWSENLGLTSLVEGMGEKRPKDAQTVGGILGLGTEVAVPTGGAFKAGQYLLNKASKVMGKVKDGKNLNKLVEDKISDSGQSRRDFMSLVGASGLMVALKSIGLGGLFKAATKTKKLDDIEIQVRGDADYEYIDEAWSGGTWANVYFKALSKKGKDILEKLTKGKDSFFTKQKTTTSMDNIDELYIPGNSEEAAVAVQKIIAGHKPNWRINTATTQIYNPATKSFAHPKGSIEGAYETTKSYSGKNLNKKTIMKEADDLIASEPGPYHTQTIVHDEYFDDILDQITTKKAEGGRIGLGTGGPPLQLGIAEAEWRAKHPVQGNKISQLKDAAMDRAFPGTGITGSLNMGNFEAFYNQPLIDPMNMFEKSQQPQYGLQYEKGPFSAGVGVMPSGETEYGFKLRKEFNDGGLTKTIPPKKGPMPQGLPSALYNGIIRPRSY